MNTNLKLITSLLFLALPLVVPQVSDASNVSDQDARQTRPVYNVETLQGRFQDGVPHDFLKFVFIKASEEGTYPRNFELVCKNWHNSMGYSTSEGRVPISGVFDHAYTTKRNDFFMEDCLHRYWGSPLNLLTLTYTDPVTGKVMSLKTSGSEPTLNGIFDLSECGKTSKYLCITKSVKEFLDESEEKKDRGNVLLITHALLIKGFHGDKFKSALEVWNPVVAPVALFWRWGNEDLSLYDYLVKSSMQDLCSKTIYENWVLTKGDSLSKTTLSIRVIETMCLMSQLQFSF